MSWKNSYAGYDDEALATLANAGLVRRALKDVAAGQFGWLREEADGGVVLADGQQVQLDGRGIPAARCDCPAPGLCKHILGAVIWLRGQSAELSLSAPLSLADVTEEILALDATALFKAVGIAAVRSAAALLAEIKAPLTLTPQPRGVQIELPELALSVRFICGAGLAGMVSDATPGMRDAVHLFAVLAVWQSRGKAVPWPAGVAVQCVAGPEARQLSESERLFLLQTASLLEDLLGLGLSHISKAGAQRLQMLNMSARAVNMPRLAAMLRNLAGEITRLEARDIAADIRSALGQMARLQAWLYAAEHSEGEALELLLGGLKRDYLQQNNNLSLLPLGGWWWETPGGARGLTLAFWSAEHGDVLHAVQARPNALDTLFNPVQAWGIATWWRGAGSAETICHAPMSLTLPRLDADGRLALGGECLAESLALWAADDPRLGSMGWSDWSALKSRLAAAQGLSGRPVDSLLLRPAGLSEPWLDEVGQQFRLQVTDAAGRCLTLALPCVDAYTHRMTVLEQMLSQYPLPLAILVSVHPAAAGMRLEPVSLLVEEKGCVRVIVLHSASLPKKKSLPLLSRILRLMQSRRQQVLQVLPSLAGRLTAPVEAVLESLASTGRRGLSDNQRRVLIRQAAQAEACGLETLQRALQGAAGQGELTAADLLRLYYLTRRLAGLEASR